MSSHEIQIHLQMFIFPLSCSFYGGVCVFFLKTSPNRTWKMNNVFELKTMHPLPKFGSDFRVVTSFLYDDSNNDNQQPATNNNQQKSNYRKNITQLTKWLRCPLEFPVILLHLGTFEVEPIYWKNGGLCLHGSVSGKNMWHRTTTDTKTTLAPLGSAKKLGSNVSR